MKVKAIVLTGVLLLAGIPLFAAYDAFLKIDGVPGESKAAGHEGWIELTSFSWGVTATGAHGAGGGGGAGKCAVHDISVTKLVDKSSPKLMEMSLQGRRIPSMTFEAAGERHLFQDVIIKSVRQAAMGDGSVRQTIDFAFTKCATHEGSVTTNSSFKNTDKTYLKIEQKVDQKVASNGLFTIGGGPQGPIILQDLNLNGNNSAIIAVDKGDQLLLPAVQRAFQSKQKLPTLTLSAYQTGGSGAPSADHKAQYMTFTFHEVTITNFSMNRFTIHFNRFDGPMTGFHDVFPK